jgi:HlyD family secretion protein
MKFVVVGVAVLAAIAILFWALLRRPQSLEQGPAPGSLRTATVERGDFVRTLRLGGTVEAVQSLSVMAPQIAGEHLSSLILTRLAPAGAHVKQGDVLAEFDRQDQIKNFLDKQAEYLDDVDQIAKQNATEAAARAKDETDLKTAEDALKTAQLEMQKNEVISKIDAEKNRETLLETQATYKQLGQTFDLKRKAAQAALKELEIKRDAARLAMTHAQQNEEKMLIRSPMDGVIVLNTIWKGGKMGVVDEGEEVRPGVPFMRVVDPSRMDVRVKVNQEDVAELQPGQSAEVRLDAYPQMVFTAKLEELAPMGTTSGLSDKVHTFTALFSIQGANAKLMPDLSAAVDVQLGRVSNALMVPRDSILTEKGVAFVMVKKGAVTEKQAVTLGPSNDLDSVVESGLKQGETVLRGQS